MENRLMSRISAVIMAVFVFAGMIYINAETANAEADWSLYLNNSYFAGQTWWIGVGAWDTEAEESLEGEITGVESSAPKIIKVKKDIWKDSAGDKHIEFFATGKKTGKSKLTVNFKKPDGSEGTLEKTVTIKKYPKEIRSLKVSGKKVKTGKYKYSYTVKKYKKTTATVKMKLKKGWKISGVYVALFDPKAEKSKSTSLNKNVVLKGKKIKFPKKYKYLDINVTMVKGSQYIDYYIGYTRN